MNNLTYLILEESTPNYLAVGDIIRIRQEKDEEDFWVIAVRSNRVYVKRLTAWDQIWTDIMFWIARLCHALHI